MIRSGPKDIPWGQLTMKIIQMISMSLCFILAVAWSSKGISFTDLRDNELNQAPAFEFLIVVSICSIIWPIVSIIIFLIKQELPAIVVLVITSVLTFFLIISVSVFAAAVYDLSVASATRALDLNLAAIEAACFFGVVTTLAYLGDLILEIIALVFGIQRSGKSKLYRGSCCKAPDEFAVSK